MQPIGEMTAEWLHLPPPYPPGVGPLCGAELEAWYEDLQDILGSDTGGAKLARAPTCTEVSSWQREKAFTPTMSVFSFILHTRSSVKVDISILFL